MKDEIINYIQEVAFEKDVEVEDDIDLFASGIFDSMEIILFLTFLDEKLNIKFEFSDLNFENFQTIDSILNWIEKIK